MVTIKREAVKKILVPAIGLLAVAFGLWLGKKGPLPRRDFPEIRASGILNIVTEYNSEDYYVSGDTLAGFQYDLCRYIERRSGLKINLMLKNDWADCLQMLEQNRCDIIALNIPITGDGKSRIAFTTPLARNKLILVQRKSTSPDSLIRNLLHLADQTVWVTAHSPAILRLNNLAEEIAAPIHIHELKGYTQEHLLSLVAYGEADYAVVIQSIATQNAALFPNLDTQTEVGFTQLQGWGVRKNAVELLDSLDRWMGER